MVEQKQGEREVSAAGLRLWTGSELNDLLADAGVLVSGIDATVELRGVNIDSREIAAGQLFIALAGDPGSRFHVSSRSDRDGHDFVAAAAGKGASAAIVTRRSASLASEFPTLTVTDTYDALWALGRAASARYPGPKVAVTGSSGKTTLKAMLQTVFDGHATPGSFNNHIGVPLSLSNTRPADQPLVIEVGTSHPGEIEPLANMVQPDLAVVLNVGLAHAENFASYEDIYDEKTSIFKSLKNKSNSVWEYSLKWPHGLSFGIDQAADVQLQSLEGDLGRYNVCGNQVEGRVPGGGEHRALTLGAALACCHLLGRDLQPALELPDNVVPGGRGNEIQVADRVIVDDSYNANPASMLHAIEAFLKREEDNKILVIGEMLELGEQSGRAHDDVAHMLVGQNAVLVGSSFLKAAQAHGHKWVSEVDDALVEEIVNSCPAHGAIFVKGSNRVFWQTDFVGRLQAALSE